MNVDAQSWFENAISDFDASKYLFEGAKYPQALYYVFQSIEKLLKCAQIEITKTDPNKIHRLESLAVYSGLPVTEEQLDQLTELSKHYGRVRYADYAKTKYNTREKTETIYNLSIELYLWIKTQLEKH